MELSSSQLTKSMIFQRGWNHQPVFYDHMFILYNYIQLLYIIELYTYNLYTYIVLIYIYMHITTWLTTYTLAYHTYVRDCIYIYIYRFCKGVIFHCQVWLPECKNSEDPHISSIFFWEGARVYLRFTHGQNSQSLPPADPWCNQLLPYLPWFSQLWKGRHCRISATEPGTEAVPLRQASGTLDAARSAESRIPAAAWGQHRSFPIGLSHW